MKAKQLLPATNVTSPSPSLITNCTGEELPGLALARMPSCRADFEWGPRLGTGAYGSVFRVRRFADGLQYVVKEVARARQPTPPPRPAAPTLQNLSLLALVQEMPAPPPITRLDHSAYRPSCTSRLVYLPSPNTSRRAR